jgi:hypothetical protein
MVRREAFLDRASSPNYIVIRDKTLLRCFISEALNAASPEYLRKEAIKDTIQNVLVQRVSSGEISSQEGVDDFFKTVDMAARTLRAIPFEVWSTVARPRRRGR